MRRAHRALAEGQLVTVGTPGQVYGDVNRLLAHHVRPPQVTTTFHLLGPAAVPSGALPTRLAEASAGAHPTAENDRGCARLPLCGPRRPLLTAENVHHTYADGTSALRGVSLSIREGSMSSSSAKTAPARAPWSACL